MTQGGNSKGFLFFFLFFHKIHVYQSECTRHSSDPGLQYLVVNFRGRRDQCGAERRDAVLQNLFGHIQNSLGHLVTRLREVNAEGTWGEEEVTRFVCVFVRGECVRGVL